MQSGLVAAYDAVEFFASAAADYSMSDAGNGVLFSAALTTWWCPDPVERLPFVQIAWSGTVAAGTGVVYGVATVAIPPLGIGPVTASAANLVAVSEARVLLADFRLYQRGAAWYASWSALTVTLGSTVTPFGAGSIVGPRLAPTGVPFLGIPPAIETMIAPSATQVSGPIVGREVPGSHIYGGGSSCSGGYHVKEVGAADYTAFPVRTWLLLGGTTGCPCEPSLLPAVGALDTASGSVTAGFNQTNECVYRGRFSCTVCPDGQTALVPAQWDVWDTTAEQETCRGSITLLPDLPKSVRRLGTDYTALVFRGGLPQTTAAYSDVCLDFVSDVYSGNVQLQSHPHPRESAFLGTVTTAPHVLETPFAVPTPAPYGWSAAKLYAQATAFTLVQPGACPTTGEGGGGGSPGPCFPVYAVACEGNRVSSFPARVDDAAANPQLTPGLYHADPVARYVDYWSSPQWNYAYWFPPDVLDGPLQPFEWPLDGARANPSDYWIPARTQWVWNPKLPASEATRKRTDLVSAPLKEGGLGAFWAGFFGG